MQWIGRSSRRAAGATLAGLFALIAQSAAAAPDAAESAPDKYCHTGVDGEICISIDTYPKDVCAAIGWYAETHNLPKGFFARLIWTESRFNANAVSPKNAQGIAQFIPSTARIRGLKNAFNPAEALSASAQYLRFLADKFGNVGLAAVAYNAGEGRAARVKAGNPFVPYETQNYVAIITGHSVDDWLEEKAPKVDFSLQPGVPFEKACLTLATKRTMKRFATPSGRQAAPPPPWGVQLAAHPRRAVAQRMLSRVRSQHAALLKGQRVVIIRQRRNPRGPARLYAARIGKNSRAEALSLCKKLRSRGAACTVAKN